MNIKSISIALLGLVFSASAFATTYTYNTDASINSTGGGTKSSPLGGSPLILTAGEQFTVSTDPSQIWLGADTPGDPNAGTLTTTANGTTNPYWNLGHLGFFLPGLPSVQIGSLIGEINGVYAFIGAGTKTFTAWETGALTFQYADINKSDNAGIIVSNVTVPEPMTPVLVGFGLLALLAMRRKTQQ